MPSFRNARWLCSRDDIDWWEKGFESRSLEDLAFAHDIENPRPYRDSGDVATLPVQPGKSVTLAPGGYHIMLTGLKQPLQQGDTFPLTLNFEKAGQVTATVTVQKAGGGVPMGGTNMPGMQMPGDGKTK